MPRLVRELVGRRERRWARDADGFLAVSDPVADLVARRWSIPRPALLLNCPPAWRPEDPMPQQSDLLRRALGLSSERPIVLYQGGLSVDRGIEELVEASDRPEMRELDIATVFLGYGRLAPALEAAARRQAGRIFLHPAVPPDELLAWTAGADLAYVGQPSRSPNWRMNLPNKLFESLMAGVPVIVSEGNEQCRLVTAEKVGTCTEIEPASIARAIAALLQRSSADREALRRRCRSVALERYTWEANAGGLVELYRTLAAS
jgi:glycosyltransferase involved in cell wall biosynthesis